MSSAGKKTGFDQADITVGELARRERNVRDNFWRKFQRVARRLPFAPDLVAAYYCAMDPATPLKVRGALLGALAYFILPLDAVPDFILGFGYADDAAILAGVVKLVSDHIRPEHREAASKAIDEADDRDSRKA